MTTQEVIDALPADFGYRAVPITRASFRGKQDTLEVFQLLWEAEDPMVDRVGDSTSRRQKESGENSSGRRPEAQQILAEALS